jgi:hypothetical protein
MIKPDAAAGLLCAKAPASYEGAKDLLRQGSCPNPDDPREDVPSEDVLAQVLLHKQTPPATREAVLRVLRELSGTAASLLFGRTSLTDDERGGLLAGLQQLCRIVHIATPPEMRNSMLALSCIARDHRAQAPELLVMAATAFGQFSQTDTDAVLWEELCEDPALAGRAFRKLMDIRVSHPRVGRCLGKMIRSRYLDASWAELDVGLLLVELMRRAPESAKPLIRELIADSSQDGQKVLEGLRADLEKRKDRGGAWAVAAALARAEETAVEPSLISGFP